MNNRKKRIGMLLCSCLVSLSMAGCMKVGPDYKRQAIEVDNAFENTVPEQLDPAKVIRPDWWQNFGDTTLNSLVDQAIDGSFDLKIMLGRIRAAGAVIDQSEADLYPSLGFDTGARFADSKGAGDQQSFNASANLSWELDLWGKNKRAVDASKAEKEAIKADYRAGYLTLVSNVAEAYFVIRRYDASTDLADRYLKNNEMILSIYQQQFNEGIVSEEKVFRQRAQVNVLRQEALEMKRGRTIQEHKMAMLLGRPPGKIKITKDDSFQAIRPIDVPVGLPSALLNRRPDILAAEYRLLKASQQIGIAEAARLPSISLTASGGVMSSTLTALLSGGMLSFVPRISVPIFDAGKRKAEVERVKFEFEIAKNEWAKVANTAFQEVADSLTNLSSRRQQLLTLQARVADLKKIQSQIESRLKLGLVSQLELIDVEETLYEAEKAEQKMDTQLFSDTILLYKALGGGWPSTDTPR